MEPDAPAGLTFTPQLGDIYTMLALCGAGFVMMVFLAWRLGKIKNSDPRQRVLLPMLAYFMALLALMGFLGSFWSMFKYPDITISDRSFMVNEEEFSRPRQSEIRLENYTSSGLGNGGRVLLIQTKDRRTWAFPEDRYPINELMRALKGD